MKTSQFIQRLNFQRKLNLQSALWWRAQRRLHLTPRNESFCHGAQVASRNAADRLKTEAQKIKQNEKAN